MQYKQQDIDILDDLEIEYDAEDFYRIEDETELSDGSVEQTKIQEIDEVVYIEESETKFSTENERESHISAKKKNTLLSHTLFFGKYIVTSALIFGILMVSTNYSAYLDIAKSYVFKEKIAQESKQIIASVEASTITTKKQEQLESETMTGSENKEEEEEKVSQYSLNKLIKESNKKDIDLNIEITPYENRIVIPKIGKNVPLIDIKNRKIEGPEELNDIFMEELENGVIRYPGSAKPGDDGTAFVFGHSSNFPWIDGDYNEVFSLLDNVVYNDEVIVYYGQKKYVYKIKEKKVIKPGDVGVLTRNKNKSELTLMTCWPLGTTLKRLVVTGELVEKV